MSITLPSGAWSTIRQQSHLIIAYTEIVVEGAAHLANVERPNEFNAALLAHLRA